MLGVRSETQMIRLFEHTERARSLWNQHVNCQDIFYQTCLLVRVNTLRLSQHFFSYVIHGLIQF